MRRYTKLTNLYPDSSRKIERSSTSAQLEMKKREVTTDSEEIKRIIRDYIMNNSMAINWLTWKKMDRSSLKFNLPRLNKEEIQRVESDTTERLPKVLYRLAPAYLIVLISHNLSPHDTTITQPSFCSLAPGSRSLHLLSLRSIHLGHSASLPLAAFAPRHSGLPLSITSESLWPLT